jgi:SAM-dependent methyltransferase
MGWWTQPEAATPAPLLAAHQQKYCAAIRRARQAGADAFQAWFNREAACTPQQHLVRAHWDFALHMLTPTVCAYLDRPEERVALEIGSGGGRLLLAACRYFREVIGVDIHDEQAAVAQFLQAQHAANVRLLRTTGDSLPVDTASVDFVFSFIVLQHLPSFAVFAAYLHETARCLRRGGVAQLYFGRFARLHPLHQLLCWRQGYRATPAVPANHMSLVVRLARVRRLCASLGLRVVESGTSYFLVPDGYPRRRGGQSYVTLVKR